MNTFDLATLSLLNQLAQRSSTFDLTMVAVSSLDLVKGYLIVPLLWWAWFRSDPNSLRDRELVLSILLACLASLCISRSLQVILPFRPRPIDAPDLAFTVPYSMGPRSHDSWSSFPSDHATMFFALATGLFFLSRYIGALALTHAVFVICIPRIYVGLHYPTDIIAGAFIGSGIAYVANTYIHKLRIVLDPILRWNRRNPGGFYACLFILTSFMVNEFWELRRIASYIFKALGGLSP